MNAQDVLESHKIFKQTDKVVSMYGSCKDCGQMFGSFGNNDRDGKLIMFQECEHLTPRDKYKVISFQEAISCGADNFTPSNLQNRLNNFKVEAQKENKNLWIQLVPTDLSSNPKKPEDVSRNDIRFSLLPFQIADMVTVVFEEVIEMVIKKRNV